MLLRGVPFVTDLTPHFRGPRIPNSASKGWGVKKSLTKKNSLLKLTPVRNELVGIGNAVGGR